MEYNIQSKAFTLLQNGEYAAAIELLDANNLLTEKEIDWEILKLFNNYLIACLHSNQIEKGLRALDKLQESGQFNPHIYHNAACLYCKSGMFNEAILQIRLAKKFGGAELIDNLKNDPDLAPITNHPDFVEVITPIVRRYPCQKITVPFEGVDHFQFDDLEKDEMVSMFFIFQDSFDDLSRERITSVIDTITQQEEWRNSLVINTSKQHGWRDGTFIGKDFITLHIKNVWQPKALMKELYNLMLLCKEELIESFFVKRELKINGDFGSVNLSINESALATIFAVTTTQEEFWHSSFNYAEPYPAPEYTGQLMYYGHHNGSQSAELRSLTYDPFFRISYGLVVVTTIEDDQRSRLIYDFVQNELAKYFEAEIPIVLNAVGAAKIDRITAYGRIGYAIEIMNNEILEYFYTRYVLRIREAEILKALKDAVLRFKLSPVIHWHRDRFYTFHLWEPLG